MSPKYSVGAGILFIFFLALVSFTSCNKIVIWLKKNLIFLGKISSGFKKANLVSMTRAATINERNVSREVVAATFENKVGSAEVSGEKVWKNFEFFDARKSDYLMEKVNFPDNTLIYLNQLILQSRKIKNLLL